MQRPSANQLDRGTQILLSQPRRRGSGLGPAHLVDSGLPTKRFSLRSRGQNADGLPLYRQESIYARDRVDLDRSLMAQWVGTARLNCSHSSTTCGVDQAG
ncbi:transposase [Bradyrhizobium sp. Pear77]|uniref:IS66 family transposase n=1 Tax=Bradyrhizobium altum TaxID=1571202 RepID=UPI0035DC5C52|nr:transposase [Bradyrhizobium altum]